MKTKTREPCIDCNGLDMLWCVLYLEDTPVKGLSLSPRPVAEAHWEGLMCLYTYIFTQPRVLRQYVCYWGFEC